jgi:hypothetical protein
MPPNIIQIGESLIYAETVAMLIPDQIGATRHAEFRLPLLQPNPVVTATIHSKQSPGAAFTVSTIKIGTVEGKTQITILASNVEKGVGVCFEYYCNVVVVGKVAKAKPARRKKAAE